MYYTQIVLNTTQRSTIQALDDVYKQHKLIMSGFKEYTKQKLGRVLYRIECPSDGRIAAIIQSNVPPTYAADLVQSPAVIAIETKEVLFSGKQEPTFNEGLAYRFRMRANTVIKKNGKRIGIIRETALRLWFEKRAQQMGVTLCDYDVIDEGYVKGKKAGKEILFKIAKYEGLLTVEDGEKFSKLYVNGFGHARSFGCGLISLARI
jgi:CRISPR system Cascade subunit CasE